MKSLLSFRKGRETIIYLLWNKSRNKEDSPFDKFLICTCFVSNWEQNQKRTLFKQLFFRYLHLYFCFGIESAKGIYTSELLT